MAASTEQRDTEQYVEFDEYIAFQLQRTRSNVRLTDLLTAAVGASVLGIAYLLVFVVLDHWAIPGGFNRTARILMLLGLLAVVAAWIAWKLVVPYLKSVSALFAARLIEKSSPDLKGSLLNLVDLERAGREIPEEIRRAIEKRAAVSLTNVDVDHAVDRRMLMRLSYTLFFSVLMFCLYTVLSPKKPWTSLWRAMLPAANVSVSTRTEILRVQPGNVDVLARAQLEVTVDLRGEIPDRTLLLYTTADRKFVDEPIEMRLIDDTTKQFRAVLTGENGRGILQNITYRIEAGDAFTDDFQVTVNRPPSATVESLHYEYPAYMELSPVTQSGGHLDAWEGTKVSLAGRTNVAVRSASLRFSDMEDRNAKAEEVVAHIDEGTKLSADWKLALRSDGTTPRFYHVQCRNENGETDPEPILYNVKIRPDQPPDVALLHPSGDLEMPANGIVPLAIEASDPDFKLRRVKLQIEKGGEEIIGPEIFEGTLQSYKGSFNWPLKPLNLKPGETISFWIEAQDNKQPIANRKNTPKLRIHIKEPVSNEEAEKQLAEEKQKQQDAAQHANADRQAGEELAKDQQPEHGKNTANDAKKPQDEPGEKQQREGESAKSEQGAAKSEQDRRQGDAPDKLGADSKSGEKKDGSQERLDPENEANDQEALQKIHDRFKERQQEQRDEKAEQNPNDERPQDAKNKQQEQQEKQSSEENGNSKDGDNNSAGKGKNGDKQTGKPSQQGDSEGSHDASDTGNKQSGRKPGSSGDKDGSGKNKKDGASGDPKDKKENSGKDDLSEQKNSTKDDPKNTGKADRARDDNKQQAGDREGAGDQKQHGDEGEKKNAAPQKSSGLNNSGADDPQDKKKNDKENNSRGKNSGKTGNDSDGAPDPKNSDRKEPSEKRKEQASGDEKGKGEAERDPKEKGTDAKNNLERKEGSPAGKSSENISEDKKNPSPGDQNSPAAGKDAKTGKGGSSPESDKSGKNAASTEKNGKKPSDDKKSPEQPEGVKESEAGRNEKAEKLADPGKKSGEKGRPTADEEKSAERNKENGGSTDPKTQKQKQPGDARKDDTRTPQDDPLKKSAERNATERKSPDAAQSDKGDQSKEPEGGAGNESQQGKPGEKSQPGKPGEQKKQGDKQQKQPGAGQSQEKAKQGEGQNSDQPSQDGATPGQAQDPKQGGTPGGSQRKNGDPGGAQDKTGEGNGKPSKDSPPGQGSTTGRVGGNGRGKEDSASGGGSGKGEADGAGQGEKGKGQGEGEAADDQADLEVAKHATNLVLRKVQDEMSRGEVDQKLLDELGWTKEEMQRFTERLKNTLEKSASADTPEARARQRQFEEILKSLDLKSHGNRRSGENIKKRSTDEIGPRRAPTPTEYREHWEAFTRSLSKQGRPVGGQTGKSAAEATK